MRAKILQIDAFVSNPNWVGLVISPEFFFLPLTTMVTNIFFQSAFRLDLQWTSCCEPFCQEALLTIKGKGAREAFRTKKLFSALHVCAIANDFTARSQLEGIAGRS